MKYILQFPDAPRHGPRCLATGASVPRGLVLLGEGRGLVRSGSAGAGAEGALRYRRRLPGVPSVRAMVETRAYGCRFPGPRNRMLIVHITSFLTVSMGKKNPNKQTKESTLKQSEINRAASLPREVEGER